MARDRPIRRTTLRSILNLDSTNLYYSYGCYCHSVYHCFYSYFILIFFLVTVIPKYLLVAQIPALQNFVAGAPLAVQIRWRTANSRHVSARMGGRAPWNRMLGCPRRRSRFGVKQKNLYYSYDRCNHYCHRTRIGHYVCNPTLQRPFVFYFVFPISPVWC